jgi:cytochrome P450
MSQKGRPEGEYRSAQREGTPMSAPTFPMPRSGSPLDPPPEYAMFRAKSPMTRVTMWDGRHAWIVTRRKEVLEVLSSPHMSVDPSTPGYPYLTPARVATVKSLQTFITMDPPNHTHFRRMLTGDFTQKRMEELRPRVQQFVDGMIDEMQEHGPPADLVEALALRLPVTVVSLLVGVPLEDHDKLVRWSGARLDLSLDPAVTDRAANEMLAYFDALVREREAHPRDSSDLLGKLVAEQIRPGRLSRQDAVHMLNLLYFAGHETTGNQIALGALSLLLDARQRAILVSRPELVPQAVEEMLRYHTPTHYNSCRVATADVTIGGQLIRAGDGVYPLLAAANRDPAAFPDPDRFDIERSNANEQVTFSFGLHQCIGQPLARLELQTVFATLFRRIPAMELAVPFDELRFKKDFYVYGLFSLPVRW